MERTLARLTIQHFGTSRQFLDGGFAPGCAAWINRALDPEKQMDHRRAPALHADQSRPTSLIPPPSHGDELSSDTGRAWREECGVVKAGKAGVSAARSAE